MVDLGGASAGVGDAMEIQLGSGRCGRRRVRHVGRHRPVLSAARPVAELRGIGQGRLGRRFGFGYVESTRPLWRGQPAGLDVHRRARARFFNRRAAAGRSVLSIIHLSLPHQGSVSIGAAGSVPLEVFSGCGRFVRLRASRVAGRHPLRLRLSRAGLLEEAPW